MSKIEQVDGNASIISSISSNDKKFYTKKQCKKEPIHSKIKDKISTALNLPTVGAYNVRSLFPKVGKFKIDLMERKVDCAFVSEIWQRSEDGEHLLEIEKMLELDGLKYISTTRPTKNVVGEWLW